MCLTKKQNKTSKYTHTHTHPSTPNKTKQNKTTKYTHTNTQKQNKTNKYTERERDTHTHTCLHCPSQVPHSAAYVILCQLDLPPVEEGVAVAVFVCICVCVCILWVCLFVCLFVCLYVCACMSCVRVRVDASCHVYIHSSYTPLHTSSLSAAPPDRASTAPPPPGPSRSALPPA
jgi:hypothetical protein